MALDFPNSPAEGQVYSPPGGPGYVYRTNRWTGSGAATDPSTAGVDAFWVTRADLVADVAGGLVVYPGKEYVAGGYSYVGKAGSTAISDLPGLEPMGTVTPFHFGGVGDGVVDDRAAIQKALDYLFANGYLGGTVDLSGGRWLVDSGNINMRFGTALVGGWHAGGNIAVAGTGDHHTDRSCIVLNQLYTINMKEQRSTLKGLTILRKGIANPTTMRESIIQERAMAGTAVSVGDLAVYGWGAGVSVRHCFIVGFEYGIRSRAGQTIFEYVWGDCRNGIDIMESHDWQHMNGCHFWGWLIGGTYFQQYTVTNAVNNGSGLVRITVAPVAPIPGNPAYVPLVTGDYLNVRHVGGTTEINEKRWTITVINPTTFDLQGSVFTNAFTSAGEAAITPYSHPGGTAFNFSSIYTGTKWEGVDGGQMQNCCCYGYDVGFNIGNCAFNQLINCSVDYHALAQDYTTIGIRLQAVDVHARNPQLIGCRVTGVGTGVLVNLPPLTYAAIANFSSTGCRKTGILVRGGYALITDAIIEVTGTGISVEATAEGAQIVGCHGYSLGASLTIDPIVLRNCTVVGNFFPNESIGERKLISSYNNQYIAEYSNGALGAAHYYQKARGTAQAPLAAINNDIAMQLRGQFWDGVDQFRTAGGYRLQLQGAVSASSVPGLHVWSVVDSGSTTLTDRLALSALELYPTTHRGLTLGKATSYFENTFTGYLTIRENMPQPAAESGGAKLFITSDGDLKIIFADGVIKTIVVDT